MENKDYSLLSDEELLVEKKKLKKSKILSGFFIGFLGGVLLFGLVAWFLSPEKRFFALIPMLIPVWFIYGAIRQSKNNEGLEAVLKERQL